MESRISGITVVGGLRWKAWPGLIADVWDVECTDDANGEYVSHAPRLFVLLETQADASIHLMCSPMGEPCATLGRERPMCFVPAGMPLWSRMNGGGRLKHLDIHFDLQAIPDRFPGGSKAAWNAPRLTFSDSRLMALARLFAMECDRKDAGNPLYERSLVAALLAAMGGGAVPEPHGGGLAAHQLRRVTRFIDDNCTRNIRLQELADLVGLSPSYFSQVFKASTGLPPHRWQLRRRVERVKALLSTGEISLTEIAVEMGFSDQAHLTRVFQRFTGSTPAAWQREHKA
ncbi:AraC family transcriptional regulator [Chelativorans sp. AA-79]|uniref:AraC family transcriptional regulator n=1 Tax=Chelativorans sp. AA-79 TaxID=3028735 RepID=UPI0023F6C752|nr:AraC family transcriptional regulator [Chelativorans sp. AA-79]WEX08224.1 AraC family transcriptional regulator [Chelativorans sp. AA-79]